MSQSAIEANRQIILNDPHFAAEDSYQFSQWGRNTYGPDYCITGHYESTAAAARHFMVHYKSNSNNTNYMTVNIRVVEGGFQVTSPLGEQHYGPIRTTLSQVLIEDVHLPANLVTPGAKLGAGPETKEHKKEKEEKESTSVETSADRETKASQIDPRLQNYKEELENFPNYRNLDPALSKEEARKLLIEKPELEFVISPDIYDYDYHLTWCYQDKTMGITFYDWYIRITEQGFVLIDPETKKDVGKNPSLLRLLKEAGFINMTPEEQKEWDDKREKIRLEEEEKQKADHAIRMKIAKENAIEEIRKQPAFKNITEEEARKELKEMITPETMRLAKDEKIIIIPGKSGDEFIILGRVPPFPIVSDVLDLKKMFYSLNPLKGLTITIKRLLDEQRTAFKQIIEIQAHDNYADIDTKEAEEQLSKISQEGYRIVPGKEPATFVVLYRLPPLEVQTATIHPMSQEKLALLIDNIRKEERRKKNLVEVPLHPDFNTDFTSEKAIELLDSIYTEKTIIINADIPGKDCFYCYCKVPPLIDSLLFDPSIEDLKTFLDKFQSQLRLKVQQQRKAMEEEQKGNDEKKVAENVESSMRELSSAKVGLLVAIREKYGKKLEEMGGVEAVIKNFTDYLESLYNEHFVKLIEFLEGRRKELESFKKQLETLKKEGGSKEAIEKLTDKIIYLENGSLGFYDLSKEQFPQIFKDKILPLHANSETIINLFIQDAWFINPYHTAWRYFLNPNPWIDKHGAIYAATTFDPVSGRTEITHAKIDPASKRDLALLWLAASDSTITPIRDFTIDGMKEAFTMAIVDIARAHNWDELNAMKEGPEKQKELALMRLQWGQIVDDQAFDKPSCPMGVNQRLMDSIIGNPISDRPETRRLDPEVIRDYFKDILSYKFEKYLNKILEKTSLDAQLKFLKKIQENYDKRYVMFDDLDKDQQKFFDDFRIATEDIKAALKELKERYGERVDWLEMRTDSERYISAAHYFDTLARAPDPWALPVTSRLIEMIQEKEKALMKELEKLTRTGGMKDELKSTSAEASADREEKEEKDGKEREIKEKEVKTEEMKTEEAAPPESRTLLHTFERKDEKKEIPDKRPKPESPKE